MKNMIKDALILFGITLISGALLGLVYEVTKEPIAQQQINAKQEACKEVFSDADHFEVISSEPDLLPEEVTKAVMQQGYDVTVHEISTALDSSNRPLGYVLNVTDHEGYGGDITFTIGITNTGLINGISFLSISETAGLGMRAEDVLKPQFEGKQVSAFTVCKTGAVLDQEIDAISGATITSNAVVNGVNAAVFCYLQYLSEGGSVDE